jgi:hypothetical protein
MAKPSSGGGRRSRTHSAITKSTLSQAATIPAPLGFAMLAKLWLAGVLDARGSI